METFEHRIAGRLVRINHDNKNSYIKGGTNLGDPNDVLKVRPMFFKNHIPVPDNADLAEDEILALAGDYFTDAGWGEGLDMKDPEGKNINENEKIKFAKAYNDLASPKNKRSLIDFIFRVDNFQKNHPAFRIPLQILYALSVPNYGKKLSNNEAHFSQWAKRAYIVGHQVALEHAQMAFYCRQLADNPNFELPEDIKIKLKGMKTKIETNPEAYKFPVSPSERGVFLELAARFEAASIAEELFALHFYSDLFAAGHSERMGNLRKSLPQKFGTLGNALVNTFHDEENNKGEFATNDKGEKEGYIEHAEKKSTFNNKEEWLTLGDANLNNKKNNINFNMLVNGMDHSLSDITRASREGTLPESTSDFGGEDFLPKISNKRKALQPLLIEGKDGKIYYRKNITIVNKFDEDSYEFPKRHGYTELNRWGLIKILWTLRVREITPIINFVSDKSSQNLKEVSDEEMHSFFDNGSTSVKNKNSEKNNKVPPKPEALQSTVVILSNLNAKIDILKPSKGEEPSFVATIYEAPNKIFKPETSLDFLSIPSKNNNPSKVEEPSPKTPKPPKDDFDIIEEIIEEEKDTFSPM